MQWLSYKEKIKRISNKIVEAQRPIRILNAIKLDNQIGDEFARLKYQAIPKLPSNYYAEVALGFDLEKKWQDFSELEKEIHLTLGPTDIVAPLLLKIVDQYKLVVELLRHRGTTKFYEFSRQLWGSPKDHLASDTNRVFDMAKLLYEILSGIKNSLVLPQSEKNLTASEAVDLLNARFKNYFKGDDVKAVISDGIIADASAGGDQVKLRSDALFSLREIDILEVHEGWVHVGTTVNGRRQPVAKWLGVGPPRCTSTQEGLAVLMEIFTFRVSVSRAQRINDRIMSISKVEEGASIIDIFEYFRTEGYEEHECLRNTMRIFRGAPLEGGSPLTKDISYCKGFVENYNFMRASIRANKPYLIPYLFAGKLHVEDIPLLYRLHNEGVVDFPAILPPQFVDINGIAVWMSFSSFFNKVDLVAVQAHYNKLFKEMV